MTDITAVPTNIITGFLGTGKTSLILHLLQHKPENERWAILVNEFGEIGIDGSIFQGLHQEQQGVFIREVLGGCMCCAAGLPMQVALNQLLSQSRPDRLLIEPTGLGHPKEVLEVLSSESYQDVLDLKNILTLVDARKLSDSRYTEHKTFNEQIAIADVIVGNKQDLYQQGDQAVLDNYIQKKAPAHVEVVFAQQGVVDLRYLDGTTQAEKITSCHHHHHHSHSHSHDSPHQSTDIESADIPECGYIKAVNQGEGFYSIGWRFAADIIFDQQKLLAFLNRLEVDRMKAVFSTDKGVFAYNLASGELSSTPLQYSQESRVEIITATLQDQWESQLIGCRQI